MYRLTAAALMLTIATPAAANWQDTEWGQDLRATLTLPGVSELAATETEGRSIQDHAALAAGTRVIAGTAAEVTYFFKDGGLSMVEIELDRDADLGDAERALQDIYGPPDLTKNLAGSCPIDMRYWFDRDRGNRIEHRNFACGAMVTETIRFEPLATAENTGL